jgi:GH15 family glucan-1,4-alpha-glucosidase
LRERFGFARHLVEVAHGLPAGEEAFLACSFWLADAYIMLDRKDDGRRLFERPMSLRNDLGLLAEEYDTTAGRQVGNFPQAFSHLALANTAMNLIRPSRPADQYAERRYAQPERSSSVPRP